MHPYSPFYRTRKRLLYSLLWSGCILTGLSLSLPLVLMRPIAGTSAKGYVIHQDGRYYQVMGLNPRHRRKWEISRRQYRLAKEMGGLCAAGAIVGIGLFGTGLGFLVISNARYQRRLRQRDHGS